MRFYMLRCLVDQSLSDIVILPRRVQSYIAEKRVGFPSTFGFDDGIAKSGFIKACGESDSHRVSADL